MGVLGMLGVLSEVGCVMQQFPMDASAMLLMVPTTTLNVLWVLMEFSSLLKSCVKPDVMDDIDGMAKLLAKCKCGLADAEQQAAAAAIRPLERPHSEFAGDFRGFSGIMEMPRSHVTGSPSDVLPSSVVDDREEASPLSAQVAAEEDPAQRALVTEELLSPICCALGRPAAHRLAASSRAVREGAAASLGALAAEEVPDILVFGGHSQRETEIFEAGTEYDVDTVHRFDASSGSWSVSARMSSPRSGCAVVALGDAVYVVGGGTGGGNGVFPHPLSSADRFRPRSRQWEQLPPLRSPRFGCAAAATEGVVFVVGGLNDFAALNTGEAFDASQGSWSPLPAMARERFGCAAASVAGCVFAVGGGGAARRLNTVERLDPTESKSGWSQLPPMQTARYGCAAAAAGSALLVVGGSCGRGKPLASVERFDSESGSWSQLPDLSVPRVGCTAAVAGGSLYVLGGRSGAIRSSRPSRQRPEGARSGAVLSDVERLDLLRDASWQPAASMPVALAGCAGVATF